MTLGGVAIRNLLRNKFRTALTVAGVSVAIVAFVLLRTVLSAWYIAAEAASKDRIATRHKVTFVMSLPLRYVDEIRGVEGVKASTWANWFGAKLPTREEEFFATIAVDPKSFLEVYDEISIDPESRERWLSNRRGALVGHVLAKKFGWKVGDVVTLTGTIYPGDWQFQIDGIYTATRKSVDQSTFWFHWQYMNDSLPEQRQNLVGWVVSRVDRPERTADISAAIDRIFDEKDTQTLSMSERAMQMSFLGMVSAVLKAIDIVSIVILVIMMLILGNTIAMGVRERTSEYAVLRAIGFLPKHIVAFVLGEAVAIGVIGGGIGLAIAYPLIERGMGRWLEENLGSWFPYFRIADTTAIAAPLLAVVVALLAAMQPALRASKLSVVDGLRRVG